LGALEGSWGRGILGLMKALIAGIGLLSLVAQAHVPAYLYPQDGIYTTFREARNLSRDQIQLKPTSIPNQYDTFPKLFPEHAQGLYGFQEDVFLNNFGGEDLLEAKINAQRQKKWDKVNLQMVQDFTLVDWMRLPHPPLKSLTFNDSFYSKNLKTKVTNNALKSYPGLISGNDIQFLQNKQITDEKIKLIHQAQKNIFGSVMLIRCDAGTEEFIQALGAAVKRGVAVHLILDKTFDLLDNQYCSKRLKKMGMQLEFSTYSLPGIWREIFNRGHKFSKVLHAKYWIFDRSTAIVDGTNLIDAEVLSSGYNHLYHDFGVKVSGPVVNQIQERFVEFYNRFSKKSLRYEAQDFKLQGKSSCRFLLQDPKKDPSLLGEVFTDVIKSAQSSVILSSLEFAFDFSKKFPLSRDFYQTLIDKSKEGVNVDFILNDHMTAWGHSNIENVDLKNPRKQFMGELLKNYFEKHLPENLRSQRDFILRHQSSTFRGWYHFQFFHGKLFVVDHSLFSIGSHNLNERSFNSDIESALLCYDEEKSYELSRILTLDLVNSNPIVRGINE
jgi:phosphatidylserine/phosphatidylglycerophosphate/cardiolipin synthase-like enzyme